MTLWENHKVLTVAKTNGADPPPPPPGTESGLLPRLNLPPPRRKSSAYRADGDERGPLVCRPQARGSDTLSHTYTAFRLRFVAFVWMSEHSSSAISRVSVLPLPLFRCPPAHPERHGVLQGAVRSDPGRQHEAVHPDRLHLADEQRALAEGDGGPERELPHHGGPGSRPRAAAQSAQRLRHGKQVETGCAFEQEGALQRPLSFCCCFCFIYCVLLFLFQQARPAPYWLLTEARSTGQSKAGRAGLC